MPDTIEEKRVFDRFTARFPIKVKDSRDDYGTKLFLRNASAEGARLTSREHMYINDSISIDVKLPDGNDPLTLNGQVIWTRTREPDSLWDIGIRFHKVSLMTIQRLFKLVESSHSS